MSRITQYGEVDYQFAYAFSQKTQVSQMSQITPVYL